MSYLSDSLQIIALPAGHEPAVDAASSGAKMPTLWQTAEAGHFLKSDPPTKLESALGLDSVRTFEVVAPTPSVDIHPLPYTFRNDDLVTSTLLLSLFMLMWVVVTSRKYLSLRFKNFFRTRERENLFVERTDTELQGRGLLVFVTSFTLGLLFFDYAQVGLPMVSNHVEPYVLLGSSTAVVLFCYFAKRAAYAFVNNIFFDRHKKERWHEAYLLSLLVMSLLLLPLALLVVYFDLPFREMTILAFSVFGLVKMMLFYKCFSIFFRRPIGWLHLILYFCTLEMVPLLLMWRTLIFASRSLLLFQ